jgi:hypothetical protein
VTAPAPAQVVAVFAHERDRARAAPEGRVLRRLHEGAVRVSPRLVALGAALGFVLAALGTPVFAAVVGWFANEPSPRPLLLSLVAGAGGALLGLYVVKNAARRLEAEIENHLVAGRIVTLLRVPRGDASTLARRLELEGAVEAVALPSGIAVEPVAGELLPFPTLTGEIQEHEQFGATIVSGHDELMPASIRLEDVRIAFVGRDGRAGPVHSSTGGPGQIGAQIPEGGLGWWHELVPRLGKPIHVRLSDGEIVLLGDARQIALLLAGHREDTVSSALSRLAERFGCPDGSARVVIDDIDEGHLGLVLFGPRAARRRGVEVLARAAMAASEGASAPLLERGVA